MNKLEEVQQLLSELTRAEKAQVLQWVAKDVGDAYAGIVSTPGVCGGEPCIVRTRIPVWVLEQARRLGATEAALLNIYPNGQSRRSSERVGLCPKPSRGDRATDHG